MPAFIFVLSVRGDDVIHDVFVLFTFAQVKAEVVSFKNFGLRSRSEIKVSDCDLRLKFQTLDSVNQSSKLPRHNTNPDRQRKPAAVPSPTGKLHSTDSSRHTGYSANPKKPLVAHNNASTTFNPAY